LFFIKDLFFLSYLQIFCRNIYFFFPFGCCFARDGDRDEVASSPSPPLWVASLGDGGRDGDRDGKQRLKSKNQKAKAQENLLFIFR
jgi:hypothetical protein